MSDAATRGGFTLSMVRRRFWIVIVCAVIGAAGAYLHAHGSPKTYPATAQIIFGNTDSVLELVGVQPADANAQNQPVSSATNVGLASLPILTTRTAATLGKSVRASELNVTATAAGTSNIADITAIQGSASFAADVANTYAQQFITYSDQQQASSINSAIAGLKARISADKAAKVPPSGYMQLQTNLNQLDALSATDPANVSIAQAATAPLAPSGPHPTRDAVLGLVLGGLIGLLALVLSELLDPRLHSPGELLSTATDLQVIELPGSPRGRGVWQGSNPPGRLAAGRNLRSLVRRFDEVGMNTGAQIFVVTSTESSADAERRHDVALGLAYSAPMASGRASVGIVVLDPSDAERSAILGAADVGLDEPADGPWPHGASIYHAELPAPPGQAPRLVDIMHPRVVDIIVPHEIAHSDEAQLLRVSRYLASSYDYVIFEVPPPDGGQPYDLLMSTADTVVVVARLHRSARNAVQDLVDDLLSQHIGGEIVVAAVPPKGRIAPAMITLNAPVIHS